MAKKTLLTCDRCEMPMTENGYSGMFPYKDETVNTFKISGSGKEELLKAEFRVGSREVDLCWDCTKLFLFWWDEGMKKNG